KPTTGGFSLFPPREYPEEVLSEADKQLLELAAIAANNVVKDLRAESERADQPPTTTAKATPDARIDESLREQMKDNAPAVDVSEPLFHPHDTPSPTPTTPPHRTRPRAHSSPSKLEKPSMEQQGIERAGSRKTLATMALTQPAKQQTLTSWVGARTKEPASATAKDVAKYDIIALQEPWLDRLGRTRANKYWEVIYPIRHRDQPDKTRSILLINKNISTNCWTDIDTGSQDVTAIWLEHGTGSLDIFNIYNDCTHSRSLAALSSTLQRLEEDPEAVIDDEGAHHMLWVGDFNRHHPCGMKTAMYTYLHVPTSRQHRSS
ncbi:hypothetical protein M422DRAFT_271092, partial [Sphaerobolus stellatus SS14]